ncbi:MAG: hypothetical protein ABFR35_09315, partial [Thermodesulfobacteriota bacterium]
NNGIQERYGNDDETKWIFKQQVEQSHGFFKFKMVGKIGADLEAQDFTFIIVSIQDLPTI